MTSPSLAAEIRIVVGQLKRRLREEALLSGYSWPELRVLYRLDREGPATVSVLARGEGMRPQSMGETVASLKAAGLLQGSPDPHDGRQTVLSLTPAGVEAVVKGRAALEDWLDRVIVERLSTEEQVRLADALDLLKRLAGS